MRLYTPIIFASVIAVGGLGFVGANAGETAPKDEKYVIKTVGEPKRCVSSSNVLTTKTVSERTIDFKMRDGKTYRNSLPHKCGGMGPFEKISYQTSNGFVCKATTIIVYDENGLRNSCGLGHFQPIKKIDRNKNES